MNADDQRAAEERVLELCDMDYERAAATCAEFDRLRAELAETRRVGDAVAGVVDSLLTYDPAYAAQEKHANEIVAAWRSVRGDAPTAGGLLPDKRILIDLTPPSRAIPADQRRKLAAELRSRFVDGPVDEWSAGWLSAAGYIGSDSPIGTDAGTDLAAPAVPLPVSAVERPTDGPDSGWVPGDPVHPEQRPVVRRHCGPCLVAWTAEVKRCPECGELCTEELRKLLDRGRRRRCDCGHAVDDHTDWEGCTWMPCRCELTRTVLAEGATR